jgi:hypothetical protein
MGVFFLFFLYPSIKKTWTPDYTVTVFQILSSICRYTHTNMNIIQDDVHNYRKLISDCQIMIKFKISRHILKHIKKYPVMQIIEPRLKELVDLPFLTSKEVERALTVLTPYDNQLPEGKNCFIFAQLQVFMLPFV